MPPKRQPSGKKEKKTNERVDRETAGKNDEKADFAEQIATHIRNNDSATARRLTQSANFAYLDASIDNDEYVERAKTVLLDILAWAPHFAVIMSDVLTGNKETIDKERGRVSNKRVREEVDSKQDNAQDESYSPSDPVNAPPKRKNNNKKQKKQLQEQRVETKEEQAQQQRNANAFDDKTSALIEHGNKPSTNSKDVSKGTADQLIEEGIALKNFQKSLPMLKVKVLGTISMIEDPDKPGQKLHYTSIDLEQELRRDPDLAEAEKYIKDSIRFGSHKIDTAWSIIHAILSQESQTRLLEILSARSLFQSTADLDTREDWRTDEPSELTNLVFFSRTATRLAEEASYSDYKSLSTCVAVYQQVQYIDACMESEQKTGQNKGYIDYISARVETKGICRARLVEFVIRAVWNKPIGKMDRESKEYQSHHLAYRWMFNRGHKLFHLSRGLGGVGWLLVLPPRLNNKLGHMPPTWFEKFRVAAQRNGRIKALGESITHNVAEYLEKGQNPPVLAYEIAQRQLPLDGYAWTDLLAKTGSSSADYGTLIQPKEPGFIEDGNQCTTSYEVVTQIAVAAGQYLESPERLADEENLTNMG